MVILLINLSGPLRLCVLCVRFLVAVGGRAGLNRSPIRVAAWSCLVVVMCVVGCGQTLSSRVEPGTNLAEANFEKTLGETDAKFVVVQVYLEGCGPCMTEALHLTEKESQWRKEGVAILGLGMDETPDGPKAFFEHTGKRITYPLYLAPWFAQQQDVFITPTVFIYSAGGEQLFRTDPEQAEEGVITALSEKLRELLGERQMKTYRSRSRQTLVFRSKVW